ncbi:MAG: OmpH family outer membrane protein, partial [Pseudomonadota bacterium]|nr:OmpH family outer membrane protein [Pseudomonadota bacterium]
MNKLTFGAAAAALALAAPAAVQAQQLPAAVIAVVDIERVGRSCTPCAAALQQIQAQDTQLEQRRQQLVGPLQTQQQSLQTAVNALPRGQQPDAALSQRIQAFQTQQESAERELGQRANTLQRNLAFVQQQIAQRVIPAAQQVGQQRGATLVVPRGSVLYAAPTIDITDAVLAAVNRNTA